MDKSHIYNLGLVLGLRHSKVKALMDSTTFLDDVITAWLRKEDQVAEKGEPSWTVLVNALKHRRVGQTGIANIITKDHLGEYHAKCSWGDIIVALRKAGEAHFTDSLKAKYIPGELTTTTSSQY